MKDIPAGGIPDTAIAEAMSLIADKEIHIGLLYDTSTAAYLGDLLLGAVKQARFLGCQLSIERCEEPWAGCRAIQKLQNAGINGIILPAPLCDRPEAIRTVIDTGIPTVLVTSGQHSGGVSTVSIDDYAAAYEMTCHLLAQGHTRIAFIRGHPRHAASELRLRGYLKAMTDAGVSVDSSQIVQGLYSYSSGRAAAERLLRSNPTSSAIFAANDSMAAAAMATAARMGMRVPEDVAVAGFDDAPVATMLWPELTTIRRPISDMARCAIKMLVDQIRQMEGTRSVSHEVLNFKLVRRGSTANAVKRAA